MAAYATQNDVYDAVALDVEMVYPWDKFQNRRYKKGYATQVAVVAPNNKILVKFNIIPEESSDDSYYYYKKRFSKKCKNKVLPLKEAAEKVLQIIQGKILVGHNINTDLKHLGILDKIDKSYIRDTSSFFPFLEFCKNPGTTPKLADLCLWIMGKVIHKAGTYHSPDEDASDSLSLYLTYKETWEKWIAAGCDPNIKEIQDLRKEMNKLKTKSAIN